MMVLSLPKPNRMLTKIAALIFCSWLVGAQTFAQISITSISPTSGIVGSSVTITGTGFNTTNTNNVVFFGATRAAVTAATATSLTVTVPAGATYAAVTELNTGTALTAASQQFFNPTYTPSKGSITLADMAGKVDFTTNAASSYTMAIGDLDGDGKTDVVVPDYTNNLISVLLNTGNSGTVNFAAKVDFTTNAYPYAAAIGDIDGDGKPDIAVINNGNNTVSVFRNTSSIGSVSFAPKVDFATGAFCMAVLISDIDMDGRADLVTTSYNNHKVNILRNIGSGTTINFATKVDISPSLGPIPMAIGDIDGDGKPDIVTGNQFDLTISVLRNTSTSGSIGFATKVDFSGGEGTGLALCDMDGDGKLDVAVTNTSSNTVSLFRNTSTSGTVNFATKVDFATGTSPDIISFGDINGDGKPDLTIGSDYTNTIFVFQNTGSSGMLSFATKVDFTAGSIVVVGDIDGDGKPDLTTNNGSSTVSVLRNISSLFSTNANLSALTTTAGTLSPSFAAATTAYTVNVTNAVSSVTVTPTKADANASIQVQVNAGGYVTVTSGAASSSLPLNVGSNAIDVKVTAEDGTTIKTYSITVTRAVPLSTNANLSALTSTVGALSPSFAAATISYTASVAYAISSVTITPTKADANASIQVQVNSGGYATVASGAASSALALNIGSNAIDVKVTAQDGSTIKTYTITVTRAAPSTNADLSSLTISAGTLSPGFTANTITYTASVGNATTSVTVTPTLADATATVRVRSNGTGYALVTSGNASSALLLNTGGNTINVEVTAEDGLSVKTYTITVTRAAVSTNADLSALTTTAGAISPSFAAATTTYTASVVNAVSSVTVTPTKADANASIQVQVNSAGYATVTSGAASSSLALNVGSNAVDVKVTAEDGTTIKTYTITVTRGAVASTNANLSALTSTAGTLSPSFAAATTTYAVNVTNAVSSVTVTPTKADANASIQVQVNSGGYSAVTSGAASSSLTLNVGSNSIDIKVTAEDGTTIKIYTITVTRAVIPPGNALNFDGSNDYVSIVHNAAFNVAKITMETWVYWTPTTPADVQFLCSKGTEALEIQAGGTANGLRFIPRTGVFIDVANALKTNAWTHIAFVYDPSNTYAKVYINGVEVSYTVTSGAISSVLVNNTNDINLGRRSTNQYYLKGSLDEFRIWNVVRTQAEIQAGMFNVVSPSATGLVSSYSFDNGIASGTNTGITTLNDATSNALNGTLNNFGLTAGATSNWVESYAMVVPTATAATNITTTGFTANWTAPITGTVDNGYRLDVSTSPSFTSFVSGYSGLLVNGTSQAITGLTASVTYYYRVKADKTSVTGQGGYSSTITASTAVQVLTPPGNGLNFDGSNDYVSIVHNAAFNVAKITMETWVYWTPTTSADVQFLCSKGTEALEIQAGGTANGLRFIPRTGVFIDVANALKTNAWTHVAFVYDPSNTYAKVYINGVEVSYTVTSGAISSVLVNNTNDINLGRRSTNQYYLKGSLDEFRIWNVVRTQAEIQAGMFNVVSPSSTGLIASYSFDNGTAGGTNTGITTLNDATSNALNGTLNNFGLTAGATSNWVESYAMVVPTATAATNITTTGFTANWTAPITGTVDNGYRLDVSTSPSFTSFVSGYSGLLVNGTSQVVTGLTSGYYYYQVRADKTSVTGQGGNSVAINTVIAYTPPGNALNFDGVNDNVGTNSTLGNFGTGNFTLETWVRTTASAGVIMAKRNSASFGNFFNIIVSATGKAAFEIDHSNNTDYTIITGNTNINDGRWHHIAVVRNGTQISLYIDGSADATPVTLAGNPNINNAASLRLGTNDLGINWFAGSLDETRVYNTNLSVANIQADMVSTSPSVPASLQAYFNYDIGTSTANNAGITSMPDMTSNANTATLLGFGLSGTSSNWVESYAMVVPTAATASSISATSFTANWTAPAIGTANSYFLDVSTSASFGSVIAGSPFTIASPGTSQIITGLSASTTYYYRIRADKAVITGQGARSSIITVTTSAVAMTPPGNALNFDGANDYVGINTTLGNFGTSNFTVEAWIKTTSTGNGSIVSKRTATTYGNYFRLTATASGKASLEINESSAANYTFITGNTTINDGKWHHVAAVRTATQLLLYVDGVSDATAKTLNGNPNINNASTFSIGRFLDDVATAKELFNGNIDEVKVYNTNLSAANIQVDMVSTSSSVPVSLQAYYNFDNGTAAGTNTGLITLIDQTANTNNGTLNNFALTGSTSNWVESYAMAVSATTAATSVLTTSFTANWTAPAIGTVDNYLLDVSTNPNFGTVITGSPFTIAYPGLSQSVTGLTAGVSYYYRIRDEKTSLTGQGANSNVTTVSTAGGIVWNGTTSNDWNTASNWTPATVPTTNDAVIIPNGAANMPVSIGIGLNCIAGSLSIQSAASVNILTALFISKSISCAGTLTTNTGGMLQPYNGTTPITIAGTMSIEILVLNNSLGAIILPGSTVNITNNIYFNSGALTTNNGLVLKSSATKTAGVGPSGTISGNVTVERYIPAKSSRTWSMVASPFTQTISSGWQQQVHITGTGTGGTVCPSLTAHTNGFDATVSNAASMYVYDGTKAVGTRWTSITGTNAVSTAPGKGFRMNIRGPRSNGCSLLDGTVTTTDAVTLSTTGVLSQANKNAGSFTIDLFNNADASIANDNYMLTGNPYPSAISFSALQAGNNGASGITNAYATFAPGNTVGNYAFWDGVSTFTGGHTGMDDATGNTIASGQAFFVQGKIAGAGVTLNWAESMKSGLNSNGYFRQAAITQRLRIGYLLANGTQADEIMIRFANNASSTALNNDDIVSINSGTQNIKSIKAERELAINTRNSNFINDTVRLDVVSNNNGSFKLSFYDFDDLVQQTNANIYLVDNYTGTVQLMNTNKEYAFTVTTSIAATQGKERFSVVFSKPIPIVSLLPFSIKTYPNPVKDVLNIELPSLGETYTLKLVDLRGVVLVQQTTQLANNTLSTAKLAAGIYMLEVTNVAGKKEVIKIVKN